MPTSSSPYPKLKSYNLNSHQNRVLSGIAAGLDTKEIAHKLRLSPKTVEYHWGKLKVKLGVTSKLKAALIARRNGIK